MRYVLDNGKKMTLEEISNEVGETSERIRMLLARAIRRLRHPNYAYKILSKENDNNDKDVAITQESDLEDTQLSVRSYNCLRRAGINTIKDLLNKRVIDLLKVKNLEKNLLKKLWDL